MSGMGYCQWGDAAAAVQQCVDALVDGGQELVDSIASDYRDGYPDEYVGLVDVVELARTIVHYADSLEIRDTCEL